MRLRLRNLFLKSENLTMTVAKLLTTIVSVASGSFSSSVGPSVSCGFGEIIYRLADKQQGVGLRNTHEQGRLERLELGAITSLGYDAKTKLYQLMGPFFADSSS